MRRRARPGQGLAESAGRPGGHPGFLALTFVSILSSTLAYASAYASQAEPLVLESKIPLGDVKGRIDHLAVDAARQRLYIAELGNDTVGVVDVKARKLLWTLHGFREPQGIGYEPSTDTVYVASAGDGSVRLLHGEDLTPCRNHRAWGGRRQYSDRRGVASCPGRLWRRCPCGY